MSPQRRVDPHEVRAAVAAVVPWLDDPAAEQPPRAELGAAVRSTLRALAAAAPGHSVEVRVPPYGAVQCVDGPRHTRGTPPNVVQCDARSWLLLATGRTSWHDATTTGTAVTASGTRAGDIAAWLPIVRV